MTHVLRTTSLALVVLSMPAFPSAGQTSSDAVAAPRLVRAAGMPLNDGALAPGMLTVRIVEGAFTKDLANQTVEIEIAGAAPQSAQTGMDGRAQFAHLPIGARVKASATVGTERMESEAFDMPRDGGVRVLFVPGSGADGEAGPTSAPADMRPVDHVLRAATTAPASPVIPGPPSADGQAVAVIRAVLATATLCTFAFLALSRRPRR